MSRSFDDEDFIPWYVRDTPGWLELSLAARGAAEGIARKMGRKSAELPLGSRGLRGLTLTLRCTWEELEPALAQLFAPGPDGEPPRLVYDREANVLRDEQALARQRPTSTNRVAKHRAKQASLTPAPPAPSETPETVSCVSQHGEAGVTVPSPLLSSDLISKIPEEIPSARARPDPMADPPEYFAKALSTVQAQTGEQLRPPECWLRYAGHRANKGIPGNQQDALYWLTTVMVPEARKERRADSDKRERDAKFDRDRAAKNGGPPEPNKVSAEDQKRFAAELAARLRKGAA